MQQAQAVVEVAGEYRIAVVRDDKVYVAFSGDVEGAQLRQDDPLVPRPI